MYTHMNAEFQRTARREKVFFNEQCKEIEENNGMGKTRDHFKKIKDAKGTFHPSAGAEDRNSSLHEDPVVWPQSLDLHLERGLPLLRISKTKGMSRKTSRPRRVPTAPFMKEAIGRMEEATSPQQGASNFLCDTPCSRNQSALA